MSAHTPHPWRIEPSPARLALALMLAGLTAGCSDDEQAAGDAVLAAFGVTTSVPQAVAAEPPAPPPECRPVFRVVECVDGQEVWL